MGNCCSNAPTRQSEPPSVFDKIIREQIMANQILLYSISTDEECKALKQRLWETGISYELFEINLMSDSVEV